MVEPVDDVNFSSEFARPDLHRQTFRVLRRPEQDLPKGYEIRYEEQKARHPEDNPSSFAKCHDLWICGFMDWVIGGFDGFSAQIIKSSNHKIP
jgi:hypothetical protein